MTLQVLHVARAFSAQPTLGECLNDATIIEAPLPEALERREQPDLIWISAASPADVAAVRRVFPDVRLLATPAGAYRDVVIQFINAGADLVLPDEGVLLAAAGLDALSRRSSTRGRGSCRQQESVIRQLT